MIKRPLNARLFSKAMLTELKVILDSGPFNHLSPDVPMRVGYFFISLSHLCLLLCLGPILIPIIEFFEKSFFIDYLSIMFFFGVPFFVVVLAIFAVHKGEMRITSYSLFLAALINFSQFFYLESVLHFFASLLSLAGFFMASSKSAALCAQISAYMKKRYNKKWYEENVKK